MHDRPTRSIADGYAFDAAGVQLGVLMTPDGPAVDAPIRIPVSMFNRHGLVAGATGTGKTRTLQVMAEALSKAGVPVFAADIKGDLSGMATAGAAGEKLQARVDAQGQPWTAAPFPCDFYSLGGRGVGVPIRATVSSFGPILLSKVLGLNQVQESSLGLVFYYADQAGLLARLGPSAGPSLGDRYALAMASRLNLPVLTAHRHWAQLDLGGLRVRIHRVGA